MNNFRIESCSLRVYGDLGDTAAITKMFKLTPYHTHRKGERRSRHTKPFDSDMWLYRATNLGDQGSIEEQVCHICEVFQSHQEKLRELAARDGCTVDLYCSYQAVSNQGGFDLPPAALKFCCSVGLGIAVSIWD